MIEIRTRQKRRYIVEQIFVDKPADEATWCENVLLLAEECKLPILTVYEMCRNACG